MKGIISLQSKFKAQFSVLSHIIGTYVALFFIYSYPHEFDLVPLAVDAATQRHSCCTTFNFHPEEISLDRLGRAHSLSICFLF